MDGRSIFAQPGLGRQVLEAGVVPPGGRTVGADGLPGSDANRANDIVVARLDL